MRHRYPVPEQPESALDRLRRQVLERRQASRRAELSALGPEVQAIIDAENALLPPEDDDEDSASSSPSD